MEEKEGTFGWHAGSSTMQRSQRGDEGKGKGARARERDSVWIFPPLLLPLPSFWRFGFAIPKQLQSFTPVVRPLT